jgi:hypothetical protein
MEDQRKRSLTRALALALDNPAMDTTSAHGTLLLNILAELH